MTIAILAMFLLPLAVAAGWDAVSFRIPNALPLILVALFPLALALAPVPVALGWHLASGLLVLAVGAGLFALRLMGGGDVKLMAAAALWLGFDALALFLVVVSLAGAALTLVLLVLRAPPLNHAITGLGIRAAMLQPRAGIPYGIAIAVGGAALAQTLPMIGG